MNTLALLAALTFSTTTWTIDTSHDGSTIRVAKAVCTTGSESAAPAQGSEVGLDLFGIEGVTVFIEAAGAMTAGGALEAYVRNSITGIWSRNFDLDLTVAAVTNQSWASFVIRSDWDRIVWLPQGVVQASTVWLKGRRLPSMLRN